MTDSAKSFTARDITLHFYILDVLADGEKLSVREIVDLVSERCQEISRDAFLPDESTVRNKLKEYVSLGVLDTVKRGCELLYFRSDLIWDMEGWRDAVAFASHQALVYPLKVYISAQNGRENLLAYSFRVRRPRMYRLDRIRSVRMMDPQPEPEKLEHAGERFAEYLWGASAGSDRERRLHTLTLRIHADKDERFVMERLHRKKRNGTVSQVDDSAWEFSATAYDAQEMRYQIDGR